MRYLKKPLFLMIIFIFWQTVSLIVNKELFVPSPQSTFGVIEEMIKTGALWKHVGASFARVTLGVAIATSFATPLGFLISWNKLANRLLLPIVNSLHFIPVTCFSPLLILFFGIDEKMKIIFLVIAGFFSFLPEVIQIASEPMEKLEETAYTMGFTYIQMLWYCKIPRILPTLLQSVVNLYGVGWTYVIIAELNNTQYGLGHLMYIGSARGHTNMVFASIVLIIVVGYIFHKIANLAIRKAFPWRFMEDGE